MRTTTYCNRAHGGRCASAVLFLLLALPGIATAFTLPGGDVTVPADDTRVLLTLPDRAELAALAPVRERIRNNPRDRAAATRLARAYLELAWRKGDPRYAGYAHAALEPWWNQPDPPPDMRVLRARYRQHRHDFDAALADLRAVLERQPRHVEALLLLASIQRTRGEFAAAEAACRAVAAGGDLLTGLLCAADVSAGRGGEPATRDRLQRLLRERDLGPVLAQWGWNVLGETALVAGNAADAAAAFAQASRYGKPSAQLLARRADALLALGRPAEVRALLENRRDVDALLLRLAIAERRLDDPRWQRHRDELLAGFATMDRRGETPHRRVRARAMLALTDDPRAALGVALENWAAQREVTDAVLLLRAAEAAGRPDAADPARRWARKQGIGEPRLAALATAAEGY